MRTKYRSAIYVYDDIQLRQALHILDVFRTDFDKTIITQVYAFKSFKQNTIELQDYFYSAPQRPFCQAHIQPKLELLLTRFNRHVDQDKIAESRLALSIT
jgi:peptide-methionine (S)-S-oxide reductase